MIQLRNVPTPLHQQLKSRAALSGRSLSDYLIFELSKIAERPTPEELRARLAKRRPVAVSETPAEAIRAERDAR
ncbi:hypothetical protein [Salinisphaera sp.]|uniref:hypothetical protein n=1 Tax=Salinisphaera sp. TaxID=1914330 RepID=UPI002D79CC76|nr:hypothetical protein [Salinisphaera sp.]HET7315476.1 hypothetical protein [Salinisphaera sp.]